MHAEHLDASLPAGRRTKVELHTHTQRSKFDMKDLPRTTGVHTQKAMRGQTDAQAKTQHAALCTGDRRTPSEKVGKDGSARNRACLARRVSFALNPATQELQHGGERELETRPTRTRGPRTFVVEN